MLINIKKILFFLCFICISLIIFSLFFVVLSFLFGHDNVYVFSRIFNLDSEQNLPTLFTVLLMIFSSALLYIISCYERDDLHKRCRKWRIISVLFFALAVDEFCSLHELLIGPLRSFFSEGEAGVFYFAWVIPGFILVLFLALYFLKFLIELPRRTRFLFILSAVVYVGGALGFELVGGYYGEGHGFFNLTYNLITTIEEAMEMFGLIIFIYAQLDYIKYHHNDIHFKLL